MSNVLPLFDTAVCAEEERSRVTKGIHNTDTHHLFFSLFLCHHVLSDERTVKKAFTKGKYPNQNLAQELFELNNSSFNLSNKQ